MVACEAAKIQILFYLSTVPVFKPFNSAVFKLYWNFVCDQRKIDYINKVLYFCKTNLNVPHVNVVSGGTGEDLLQIFDSQMVTLLSNQFDI